MITKEMEDKWREESKEAWVFYRKGEGHSFGHKEAIEIGYLAAKRSSQEEIEKRDVEIRDALSFIENACIAGDDSFGFEKVEIIKSHLTPTSKERRYEMMDEVEKLEKEITELEKLIVEAREIITHAKWDYDHDACDWLKKAERVK